MLPQRIEQVEVVEPGTSGNVVPLFRGPARDPHPYEVFSEDKITKKELAAALGRSERWIERRMAEDGLPYFKVDPGRRQARVAFLLPQVQAWLATYWTEIGGR